MRSSPARIPTLSFLLIAAASTLTPSHALAAAVTHNTLADFQQNVRADVLLEPFNGPDNFGVPIPAPVLASGNGYAFSVAPSIGNTVLRTDAFGIGAGTDVAATQFTFTGKPVTAFGGTFRVSAGAGLVAGTITITTNTGETANLTVSATSGTFFATTTTQPFTSISFDSVPAAGRFESVDDVYVGTSITAAATTGGGADQCEDAPVLTLIDSTVFPFTTVGATAQAIGGVCDSATDTGADVWYRFVPTSTGLATISTCGCNFDSILRVFGSCLIAGSGQHLACNDDDCTGGGAGFMRASRVQLRVDAGNDYLIRISGFNGASGSGNLTITLHPDCPGDANHSGGLEVQDIFDFLNFWFAGCP